MITYSYNHTDYNSWLLGFAEVLGTTVREDGVLVIPPDKGEGTVRKITLPNKIELVLLDFTLSDTLVLHRTPSHSRYYTLRFDEIQVSELMEVRILDQVAKEDAHFRSAVYLTCDLFDMEILLSKGSKIKSLVALFTEEWLGGYLDVHSPESVLSRYMALKTASLNYEPLDAQYRAWKDEIMAEKKDDPLWLTRTENRVMLLVERFFSRLYKRMEGRDQLKSGFAQQDVEQLMEVEAALMNGFDSPPPTIPQLSKLASMSQSKLKKQFKSFYGLPMYQYYQKHRMHEARRMLMSGKYSVKEVGMKLGYSNLSHFSMAFKKEFKHLPREILSLN